MNEHLRMVREFHDAFSYPQAPHGVDTPLTNSELLFRMGLIVEEYSELLKALSVEDDEQILDALIDIAYFVLGTLAMSGRGVHKHVERRYSMETLSPRRIKVGALIGNYMGDLSNQLIFYGIPSRLLLSEIYYLCKDMVDILLEHNFDGAFQAVHESNMSKLGADGKPIYSPEGKILKGPNYKAPDLKPFLNTFSHSEKVEA